MARLLRHFIEPERACSYLPPRRAALEHALLTEVEPGELERLIIRGWRRFGPVYFRPACVGCAACESLRLPVADFAPTQSQRRAAKRCGRFRRELGTPSADEARLSLYASWHAAREDRRGWSASPMTEREYLLEFAFPHPAARELALYDGDRLVAVSLLDVTPSALSAVYFFYDPRIARLSPGVANVLFAVELARSLGIPHVYLGYRVRGCPSLEYKGLFKPHELLQGRPELDEPPLWRPAGRAGAESPANP